MGGFSVVPEQVTETAGKIENVSADVRATAGGFEGADLSGTATVVPHVANAVRMFNWEVSSDFQDRANGIRGFSEQVRNAAQNYVTHDQTVASSYSQVQPT
ncbi:MAG: type VII secretion target [Kineosporiaceae bacterium]